MNYLILIVAGVVGFIVGWLLAVRRKNLISEMSERKAENIKKLMEFFRENEKVANNDVEKLLGVSDSTAERYLDELEKEGKIQQHGQTGRGVFYTLKR